MQVFLTGPQPYPAAVWLLANCPKAATTTIREGQQLLSVSALAHTLDPLAKLDGTHYSTLNHRNHPWAVWLRQSYGNWHYLFHLVRSLVKLKYGLEDIRCTRLTDYADENVALWLDWVETPTDVPFYPHHKLAEDPRLKGLRSFEAHRIYCEVKYETTK